MQAGHFARVFDRQGELSLVAADGLMLRAVIGEDAAHVLHAGHEEHVSKEDHDAQQALEQVAHDLIRGDKAVQERAEQRRQHEEQRDGERQSEHDGERDERVLRLLGGQALFQPGLKTAWLLAFFILVLLCK